MEWSLLWVGASCAVILYATCYSFYIVYKILGMFISGGIQRVRHDERKGVVYFYRGRQEIYYRWLGFGWIKVPVPYLAVKIGMSKNAYQRLAAQRTSVSPYGYHVYGVMPVRNYKEAERIIHDWFDHNRISNDNEWFRLDLLSWCYIQLVKSSVLTHELRRRLEIQVNE